LGPREILFRPLPLAARQSRFHAGARGRIIAAMHRFFLPAETLLSNTPTLAGDEAHHCLNVVRHGVGDKLIVFDGRGHEATAQIVSATKREATLRVLHRATSAPIRCRLTLAQAVPKGKNMDLIIEKAVELGAARIVPLLSDRTIVQLDAKEAASKREKWQTVALEACKQCGQNWLPEVTAPVTPKLFFDQQRPAGLLLIASLQNDSRPIKPTLAAYVEEHGALPAEVTILVGPEGDFTPAELGLAKSQGCQPITLGPIILRTETAAIYCLSVLGHELFGN
jgi:16S rRNA (uracil1498-N3)-methyltransferase